MNLLVGAADVAANAGNAMETAPSELYLNRELSLLEFNNRVLDQAKDECVPLLERLRFLCISCSNLDEFFEIRVAGIKQMIKLGAAPPGPDGMTASELSVAMGAKAHELMHEQYRVLNDVLIPALEQERIRFIRRTEWTQEQDAWLRRYFSAELLPVLSPLGLDPAHPFPRLLNKSLNFIVSLSGKDAFGRNIAYAIVQAPRALPRLIQVPREVPGSGPHDYVFLSSVIHAYVDELFPGMQATGCYQFRVTRNSDLFVDEEEADDLLQALEGELSQRQWGEAVRLEVAHNCPENMSQYLTDELGLTAADVYECNGPVNLMRLMAIPDQVDRPDLKYPVFAPHLPKGLAGDMFAAIRHKDHLLHHPYDSFVPVLDLLRQAAKDPNVLAIKQTLYRTGARSLVAEALIQAARAGKEVTVVVELRARFDEADNISLAEELQKVGAHVVYGVVGYKTHAKMTLVVRREEEGLRNYVHLGTGNYHPRTARIYADYGLFTCEPTICKDVQAVFLQLTSLGKVPKLHRLLQSPFTMAIGMRERIERETANAQKKTPGADHREDERAGGIGDDPGALPRLPGRRADRPGGARHVLAAPWGQRAIRQHPRALDRRTLPRASPRLLLRERRPAGSVARQRRLDGAQPLPPRGSGVPDPRSGNPRADHPRPARLCQRHRTELALAARRQLLARGVGQQRRSTLQGGADAGARRDRRHRLSHAAKPVAACARLASRFR